MWVVKTTFSIHFLCVALNLVKSTYLILSNTELSKECLHPTTCMKGPSRNNQTTIKKQIIQNVIVRITKWTKHCNIIHLSTKFGLIGIQSKLILQAIMLSLTGTKVLQRVGMFFRRQGSIIHKATSRSHGIKACQV